MSSNASDKPNVVIQDVITAARLEAFCERVLGQCGVSEEGCKVIANALVDADLRGIHSHGVNLLPRYARGFLTGNLNVSPQMRTVSGRGAVGVFDGDNGLGHVVGVRAMDMAIDRAAEFGIGVTAVRNSNHYGAASYFALRAARRNMIGYTTTNTPVIMAAWGGAEMVLGNNPTCYAIPRRDAEPIVLDMACSVVARGKIRVAAEEGKPIPIGWATDSKGRATEDSQAALLGALLPMGGPKGSGLALVNEVLAAVLSSAVTTTDIPRGVVANGSIYESQRIGHLMMAIDISSFLPLDDFANNLERVIKSVLESSPSDADARIYLPGEQEAEKRTASLRDGLDLPATTVSTLTSLARELGIAEL